MSLKMSFSEGLLVEKIMLFLYCHMDQNGSLDYRIEKTREFVFKGSVVPNESNHVK